MYKTKTVYVVVESTTVGPRLIAAVTKEYKAEKLVSADTLHRHYLKMEIDKVYE